jgi:hypothetical protein
MREARAARDLGTSVDPAAAPLSTGVVAALSDGRTLGWVVAAFLAGILIAVAILFGYAWVSVG